MTNVPEIIGVACGLAGGAVADLLSWRISGVNLVLIFRGELVTKEVALLDVIAVMGDGGETSPPPDRTVKQ